MYAEVIHQNLGIPLNEAKIYESLLILGSSNVLVIANTAKVNRRNVYDSLKNLEQRKLVLPVFGQKETLYKCEDPGKLQKILVEQKQGIEEFLPELKKTYTENKPEEQTFISKGREGIKNFWQYVLAQDGPTYFVGGKGAWHDSKIDSEREKYFGQAKEKNIELRGIFDYEVSEWRQDVYSKYNPGMIKFFPKGYSTSATYDICGDRIVLFPLAANKNIENVNIFNIISAPLANSYSKWFEFMWNKAKTLSEL